MKLVKDNFIIKTVYAYTDLAYKAFPVYFVFMFLPLLLTFNVTGKTELPLIDVFHIFGDGNRSLISGNISFALAAAVMNIIVFVCIFISLKKLRNFIKNVFEGIPFCLDNGKHLKFVGVMIAVLGLLFHAATIIAVSYTPAFGITPSTPFLVIAMGILSLFINPYLIVGLFVVVLGEIIIHGAKLKEEVDLTV